MHHLNFLLSTVKHGCNLSYSKALDAVFCTPCTLFTSQCKSKANAFTTGFKNWHKIDEKASGHNLSSNHVDNMAAAELFKAKIEKPTEILPFQLNTALKERVEKNRHIIRWVIKVIFLGGKQCLPLRGNRESLFQEGQNPGNFLEILKLLNEANIELEQPLRNPLAKNATYISPYIQNQIMNIVGYDIIQKDLIGEIKEAKFFSILADAVECHHVEQLPVCIRFVGKQKNIREEFLEFGIFKQMISEAIAEEIIRVLGKSGLNIEHCRGQSYDGASNMSSEAVGEQGRIKRLCEKAVYTHFYGHNLSLVIVPACNIPIVRNTLDIVKETSKMFVLGSKQMNLLKGSCAAKSTFYSEPEGGVQCLRDSMGGER